MPCKHAPEKRGSTRKVSEEDLVFRYREKTTSYYNLGKKETGEARC